MSARRICWSASLSALAIAFAIVGAGCGSGSTESAPTTSGRSGSALKRVVVADLSVRVPAEWRSYDYDFGAGWKGVSLADPRHEPSDAVIFGFYSQDDPGMTAAEMGKTLAASAGPDNTSAVRQRPVTLPSGLPAYEVRETLSDHGRRFTLLAYAVVAPSGSGSRGYLILYRAIASQARHMAQFRTSAGTLRRATAAPKPSPRAVAGLKRIVVGDLAIRVPAKWQSFPMPSDTDGTTMIDPSGTITFGCIYFDLGIETTAAEAGKEMARAYRDDNTYSVAAEKLVTLPSGIPAYEVRYTRTEDGETITGVEYSLVHGTTVYAIQYEQTGSRPSQMGQFRASARTIEPA